MSGRPAVDVHHGLRRTDQPRDLSLLPFGKLVNGSAVGRPQFETLLPNVTEFTLRLPDRSARYKFYLSAVTQVGSGEVFAKEMPRFANEGELFAVPVPETSSGLLFLLK